MIKSKPILFMAVFLLPNCLLDKIDVMHEPARQNGLKHESPIVT